MYNRRTKYQGVVTPFERKSSVISEKQTTKRWNKGTPSSSSSFNYQPVPKELVQYIKKEHSLELFDELLHRAPKKSGGNNTYVCPHCMNGSGEDGTGIEVKMYRDGTPHLYCFRCGETFDIFSIFQKTQGSNYNFRKLIIYLINRFSDVMMYAERLGFEYGEHTTALPHQSTIDDMFDSVNS